MSPVTTMWRGSDVIGGSVCPYTRARGRDPPPIAPPAVIGILGGGQLGRMLGLGGTSDGLSGRDPRPGPDCPAAAIADEVIVGSYEDVEAAVRLAESSDVVTYELEHVAAAVVEAVDGARPGAARAWTAAS